MCHSHIIQFSGKDAVKQAEMNLYYVSDRAILLLCTHPACYDDLMTVRGVS